MRPVPILATAALLGLALARPATAADMLLLQQTLEPDSEGAVDLLLDRERIITVRIERDDGAEHRVEVTLAPDDSLKLRCADLAAARQVLDALRPGNGLQSLDVTGHCRF